MKHFFTILPLTVCLIVTACKECGECFTPPSPFLFELVNEQGENIFTIESYRQDQLSIKQTSDNQNFEFEFISENNLNVVEISSIGWTTEQVELSFQLAENEIFTFYVDAERKNEDCCSFTRYNVITIDGASFDLDNQTGIYKVTVE